MAQALVMGRPVDIPRSPVVHYCHAPNCPSAVEPKLLACAAHWAALPTTLRRSVWAAYRQGQEIDKRPSSAYLMVMRRCIAFWDEQQRNG